MKLGKSANSLCHVNSDNRKSNQGYVDIKNLTVEQLNELILRQNKLLTNGSFLEKLPDNGRRILFFKTELEKVKKKKQEEYDEVCQLISNLSLNNKNPEELEWNQRKLDMSKKPLDSDDDDNDDDDDDDDGVREEKEEKSREQKVDLLKLVATHSGTANGKNIKINFSKSKICNKDLKDNKKLLYVDKFCKKYGDSKISEEKFKPNQFKNNDKTSFLTSAEQVKKKLGNKWEVTQATPPVPIYKNVMMISLSESLKLQKEQAKKLKEIKNKHATEKLLQNMSLKIDNKLPMNNTTEYRNINFSEESLVDIEQVNYSDFEDYKKIPMLP